MKLTRRGFLRGAAGAAATAAMMAVGGCGPIGQKKLGAATFRMNWKASGPHPPYFLAVGRGWYKAEGIELELKEGSGSGTVAQLVGNKSDAFGLVDAAAAIPLVVQGLPIKCVAMVSPRSSLAVIARKDSGVKTLKDLEGKTLAITPGDSLTQIWPAVVAANKLDASKIKLVNVDAAAKVPSVLEKRADALLGSSADQNFILQAQGVETVDMDFADFGVNVLNLGIFVHNDTLKETDLIRAFLRATLKGLEAAEKEWEAGIDFMIKQFPELDKNVVTQQWKAYSRQLKSPNCPTKGYLYNCPQDWQQTLDIMVQYRDLKTSMKATDFYTNDFVPTK